MDFLGKPGSENVTKKFDKIIMFGFISNLIFILFQLYKTDRQRLKKKKEGFSCSLVLLEVIVNLTWIVQFGMLIGYRFCHTGKVCAGDY
mmetsp:Transcript_16757/g.25823  ORF Transcript_16757/g.25823 Transcript_16757/m.25823 type:complete len:89 (+) Transcript_16757:166-432(+)